MIMDSDPIRGEPVIDIIDDAWRFDQLPKGEVRVPVEELPDPEPDNGNPLETLREQEMKWNDFALNRLQAQPDASP
ncbi:anaphase-promoting complex subunit 13-like [Varroa jacobsoni]|uniref:Anaphase-promoting complex subunit 13 n=1 Tax=Varroa destructor TaxID=109461 RepID=A0A7M7KEB4_VARDE|nr:anaphase-promoting complex subunit 13-like [Varroa destructor]XP_022696477.1 anaphase-promoting complex subunit 13-like [Varroa jacobsoni]